jgi:hypothetical protein
MTEGEWLTCEDPSPMLDFLRGKASDRKLRLFAAACCRRVWHALPDERQHGHIVDLVERRADENATDEQLQAALEALRDDRRFTAARAAARRPDWAARSAAGYAARDVTRPAAWDHERAQQAAVLRDLFGPLPFRPVTLPTNVTAWRDGAILALAQAVYEERAFDRLPVLADVLEEAGYTDPELLGHLRGPGPHARGCWALDCLLTKE